MDSNVGDKVQFTDEMTATEERSDRETERHTAGLIEHAHTIITMSCLRNCVHARWRLHQPRSLAVALQAMRLPISPLVSVPASISEWPSIPLPASLSLRVPVRSHRTASGMPKWQNSGWLKHLAPETLTAS